MEQALYRRNVTITTDEQGVLNMINTVESTIKKSNSHLTEKQLLRRMPKHISGSTLRLILTLLKDKDKIIFDRNGTIVWTAADNPAIIKLLNESIPLR